MMVKLVINSERKVMHRLITKYPEEIRSRLLGKKQMKILEFVRKNAPVTSSQVRKKFKMSPQNASQQMIIIYKKGYLKRVLVEAASGGHEWLYDVID